MILKIADEASIWHVIENMHYFDKETFEPTKPWPGYLLSMTPFCSYDDEAAVVKMFREIRRLLEVYKDLETIRSVINRYTVLDMFDDIIMKRPIPIFTSTESWQFEFWWKMYNRRGISRSLVPVSHYNNYFNPFINFLWRDSIVVSIDPATYNNKEHIEFVEFVKEKINYLLGIPQKYFNEQNR